MAPIKGRNGKTFWLRVGNAWVNKDDSIQVWLHAFPTEGIIQIRDLDEDDLARRAANGREESALSGDSATPF